MEEIKNDVNGCAEILPDNVNTDSKSEKEFKILDLKLKIKKLREERIAKHAARVELLKKKNLAKYGNQIGNIPAHKINGSGDLSKTFHNTKRSTSNISVKSAAEKPTRALLPPAVTTISKSTSTTSILNQGNPSVSSKTPHAIVKKDRYSNVGKKVNSRLSFIPKAKVDSPKAVEAQSKTKLIQTTKSINSSADLGFRESTRAPSKVVEKLPTNHVRRPNTTALERLSRPRLLSNTSAVLAADKKLPGPEHVQSKRWTMASIDRLSRPKVIKSAPAQKPIVTLPNSKNNFSSSRLTSQHQLLTKPVPRRVTEIHKPKDQVKNGFKENVHLRRSLSTVHFKHLGAEAAKKCLKRTLSAGNIKRRDIEDEIAIDFPPKDYTLSVASDRKKSVSFLTPLRKTATPISFLNTPKPSELRQRLNDWLQKRGKSLSNYHHLHCFGIHESPAVKKAVQPIDENQLDDENKENVEVTDDDSFNEMMTGRVKDVAAEWRRASYHLADSPAVSHTTPEVFPDINRLTPEKSCRSLDPIMIGALNDLHHLILEGYSWEQCAEWLRAIVRSCGTIATETAPYWECRAALEEKRGDFPRAVECFNKAIIQGAKPMEVEASLDNLLQKFMKLNLAPENKPALAMDPKFLDVKNVFKSTLIRFAIQQKNLAESKGPSHPKPKYVATPVRRSSRLSKVPTTVSTSEPIRTPNGLASKIKKPGFCAPTPKSHLSGKVKSPSKITLKAGTPLNTSARKSVGRQHLVQLCSTLNNVDEEIRSSLVFVPNKALNFNDC